VPLNNGVVVDRDVARPVRHRHEVAAAAPNLTVDVIEQVVANQDRLRLLARVVVVPAQNLDACGAVTQYVLLERDVIDLAPGALAVLVPHREDDREPRLPAFPVVFKDIARDHHAPRVLELDQVLALHRLSATTAASSRSCRPP
jgi:hypothetical protein